MAFIALGPDAATAVKLGHERARVLLVEGPSEGLSALERLAEALADQLPPATAVAVSGTAVTKGAISCPGLGARRAEIFGRARELGALLSRADFVPRVSPAAPPGETLRFDHVIVGEGDDWRRLPLRGVAKLGPFTPELHPHGWHGYWSATGGMGRQVTNRLKTSARALNRVVDTTQGSNRMRARPGSGQAYARGPAAHVTPHAALRSPPPKPILVSHGPLKLGANVRLKVGAGAGIHSTTGKVIYHHASQRTLPKRGPQRRAVTVHVAHVSTAHGVKHVRVVDHKTTGRPTNVRGLRPRPSAYVDHQAFERWWAGAHGRSARPLPYVANRPPARGTLGRPGRVHKDGAMTVTEDLGHEGQSPVTIMQGGSRLQRCPQCGRRLTMDGHCPAHGNVLKAEDDPRPPSLAENLPGPTISLKRPKRPKPKQNYPVAPACPDCGGTDGFHTTGCPRAILNPTGGAGGPM